LDKGDETSEEDESDEDENEDDVLEFGYKIKFQEHKFYLFLNL
jgi:hypothetical protein